MTRATPLRETQDTHTPGGSTSTGSTAESGLLPATARSSVRPSTETSRRTPPSLRPSSQTAKLRIADVTLVLIETQENELGALAVKDCLRHADFGDVLIFTNAPEHYAGLGRILPVPNWTSKLGWSEFSWHGVSEHLTTPFALYIQWDSWIIDPSMWRDQFLDYDLIGAPWWYEERNVGNLGFSIRSKRILDYLRDHKDEYPISTDCDDELICREYRSRLEADGFTWAPPEVAIDFAFECVRPHSVVQRHFGFHAIGNWPLVMSYPELRVRAQIAGNSPYLQVGGHLGALCDTMIGFAKHEQARTEDLNRQAAEARYFSAIRRLWDDDYERGWKAYECRWETKWFREMRHTLDLFKAAGVPQWRGEELAGKTVMIWHEQGFGDTCMFHRYIPLVEQMAEKVIVGVPTPMLALYRANGHDAYDTLPPGEYDYHCPLMSLPIAFNTTIGTVPLPVLRAPNIDPCLVLRKDKLNIGLTWQASDKFPNNEFRSLTFEQCQSFLDPRANYVALQYGMHDADLGKIARAGMQYPLYRDFAELAALMEHLDLVISVCTGNMNLAGSLGRPAWVMLSKLADMRWGKIGKSPWYPHVRQFRQKTLNDWDPVLAGVKQALKAHIDADLHARGI